MPAGSDAKEDGTGACCMTCGQTYENPWPDVPLDTAVRAAGWSRLDYASGPRYVCRECRKPLPARREQPPADDDQLDLFTSSP